MNLARIQQQLAKDVRKSPAKAAALALLTIVALYAWAPLVFQGGSTSQAAKASVVPNLPVAVEPTSLATSTTTKGLPVPWQQLASWMDNDPRMKPAAMDLAAMERFSRGMLASVASSEPSSLIAAETSSTITMDPQSLGLKVSGTMLGKHRRVAVINGRPYAEGRQLQVSDDLIFTIVQVGVRHVVLEGAGRRFDLPVAESGTSELR